MIWIHLLVDCCKGIEIFFIDTSKGFWCLHAVNQMYAVDENSAISYFPVRICMEKLRIWIYLLWHGLTIKYWSVFCWLFLCQSESSMRIHTHLYPAVTSPYLAWLILKAHMILWKRGSLIRIKVLLSCLSNPGLLKLLYKYVHTVYTVECPSCVQRNLGLRFIHVIYHTLLVLLHPLLLSPGV